MGFGDGNLFKEIGNTIVDASKEGLNAGVAAIRTAIARDAIASPEGQAVVAQYKSNEVVKFLPFLAIGAVVFLLAGKLVK